MSFTERIATVAQEANGDASTGDEKSPRVQDPVCGKVLELTEVAAMVDHRGWAYYFCSAQCRDAFTHDPERFSERRVPDSARSRTK